MNFIKTEIFLKESRSNLQDSINIFLTEHKINRERLIDIKIDATESQVLAMIIYELEGEQDDY